MAKKRPATPYRNLATYPEDRCDEIGDELARLLSIEKGVRVVRPDAIRIALQEAVERRRTAQDVPAPAPAG